MRRAVVSACLALLLSCSKEPPPPPPLPPPPPGEPAPPLPPLGTVSVRDWRDVDPEKFLELPAPSPAPALRWKFLLGDRIGYDFSESVTAKATYTSKGETAVNTSRDRNRGVYEFVGGRAGMALAMAKVLTHEMFVNDQAVPRETFKDQPPSVCECEVTEEGAVDRKKATGRLDERVYFQSLLALAPGEKAVPQGKITTRLAGYFKVGVATCARVETEFEFAQKKPSEESLMRGRVVGYFDVERRRFVRVSLASSSSSRSNAKSDRGVWVTGSLDGLTTSRLTLLD